MTFDRCEAVSFLDSLVNLSADPDDPGFSDFVALIAEDEIPWRQEEMVKESTCALAVKGMLRHFIPRDNWPQWLQAPYINGQAPADVQKVAKMAGAVMPATHPPQPCDVVHLTSGLGGPEHLYMVRTVAALDVNPGLAIGSVDGGQKKQIKTGSVQAIKARSRIIVPKGWTAEDREFPEAGGSTYSAIRNIWYVYDVEKIVNFFGG